MAKILGFAGFSGSGKTTLIEQLIPHFVNAGVDVAVIKHTHHQMPSDKKNSDSERILASGASAVMLVGDNFSCLNGAFTLHAKIQSLDDCIQALPACDFIFVEGFKHAPIAKIEVINQNIPAPHLYLQDKNIIALVSNLALIANLPLFLRNDIDAIFRFITNYFIRDKQHANR